MYKYIIYGSSFGFYDVSYYDIIIQKNVKYYKYIEPNNQILKYLYRFCFSTKVNRIIKIPFKNIWIKALDPRLYNDGEGYCFLFFSRWLEKDFVRSYLDYLLKRYPKAKYVCFFHDLISTHLLDINYVKQMFDLVLSYDKNDSETYGLLYYPTPYSSINIKEDPNYFSDVYFLGKAKNRLHEILNVYDQLEAKGLRCRFFITGLSKDISLNKKGIKIIESMTYKENLIYVRNSKCLLEIMQHGAVGITPRTWEAIMYNKHLITNNSFLKGTNYYNQSSVTILGEQLLSNISADNIISANFSEETRQALSPVNLLSFISNHSCN